MATTIRSDLGWVFGAWMVAANLIWLTTPWMDLWAAWMGPAWIWCGLIPATVLALLFPRRALLLCFTAMALPLLLTARAARRRRGPGGRYLPQF